MPGDDPQLRASDDDRDRTASLLREHHAAGRLSPDEFQERLDATFEAKTIGQLQELLADLPSIDLYHLPEQSMRRSQQATASGPLAAPEQPGRLSPVWRHHWGSWASVNLVLFAIWLVSAVTSHSMAGLWFLWVAVPWGAILLGRWVFGQHPDGGHGPTSIQGGPPHQAQADLLDAQQDHMQQAFDDHRQRLDDHMRRHQERMQDQMQRRSDRIQEQMRRRQEQIQRRHDGMHHPDGS
jgi:Domain of unknown function (DUF1707)